MYWRVFPGPGMVAAHTRYGSHIPSLFRRGLSELSLEEVRGW